MKTFAETAMDIVEGQGTQQLKEALLASELHVDAVSAAALYEVLQRSLEARGRIEQGLVALSEAS